MATLKHIDAKGLTLIKDANAEKAKADKATGAALHKFKVFADHAYSAMGWRFSTFKAKVEANEERRAEFRDALIITWPNETERNWLRSKPAALKDSQKARVKEIRQGFGPRFALVEKYLKELEGIEKPEVTDMQKIHQTFETLLKQVQGLEAPPAGLDVVQEVKNLKAIKGRFPLI